MSKTSEIDRLVEGMKIVDEAYNNIEDKEEEEEETKMSREEDMKKTLDEYKKYESGIKAFMKINKNNFNYTKCMMVKKYYREFQFHDEYDNERLQAKQLLENIFGKDVWEDVIFMDETIRAKNQEFID